MSEGNVPDTQRGVSGLGITALVLGLLSLVVAIFMPCVGIFLVVPVGGIGLILGLIGLATAGQKMGKGIPIAGTVICVVAIGVSVYWWVAGIGAMGSAANALSAALKKEYDDAVASAKAGTSVSAADLLKEYKEDEKKADEKYKGKWVKVNGKIASPPAGAISLGTDQKDAGNVVVQPFLSEISRFSNQKEGTEVTLGGKCLGKSAGNVTVTVGVLLD